MPNTRASSRRKTAALNREKTPLASAKSKSTTISTTASKETCHYLRNITNPKVGKVAESTAVEKLQKRCSGRLMGSKGNGEVVVGTFPTSVEASNKQTVLKGETTKQKRKVENGGKVEAKEELKTAKLPKRHRKIKGLSEETAEKSPQENRETRTPEVMVVDDGEEPSTSKAALAALLAATAISSDECPAKSAKVYDRSTTSTGRDTQLLHGSLPSCRVSAATASSSQTEESPYGGEASCLYKMHRNIRTSTDDLQSTAYFYTNDKMKRYKIEELPLSDKLLLIISNLYLNAADRLKLEFPPRCAEDLEHCHQQHYRASLPPAPTHTQAINLRCALQQQRYLSLIKWSYDMCLRGEHPGEEIFTKIIELVLSFNVKCFNNDSVAYFFNKSIELFSFIVRKFPPCWLTVRPFYIKFLQAPLDPKKLSKKDSQPYKSNKVFDILLELLEKTLEQCTSEDLQCDDSSFNMQSTDAVISETVTAISKADDTLETSSASLEHNSNAENSQLSEYLNMWEWEVQENSLQTFEALKPPCARLERVFISLQLLLQILESDLVIWIIHHHKKPKDWIFSEDGRPFVVLVFALSKYTRMTTLVKQLFNLFAICVKKRARRSYLLVLERLLSLVVVASNIADLEYTASGVRYPNLGNETKSLIKEFFNTFQTHNPLRVSSYLNTIDLLRIPYVRSEFIDHFLNLFYSSNSKPMSPKKIANQIFGKRWLRFKPQVELAAEDNGGGLSREQYLHVLLLALQAYCTWHGTKEAFHLLIKNKLLHPLGIVRNTVHRRSDKSAKEAHILESMSNDIKELESKLLLTMRMNRPEEALPLADICIDSDILEGYRRDLKCVALLNELVAEQAEEAAAKGTVVDFTDWRAYLVDYSEEK